MKEQDLPIQTTGEKWTGYGACIASLGLSITHFVGNLNGYIQAPLEQQNLGLFLVWGTLPSLLFLICSWSVLALVHSWGGKKWARTWKTFTWIAFVLMSLQFIWLLTLSLRKGDFIYLYHLGPGPWSVIGSFLFGFTLWQVHCKKKMKQS